MPAPMSDEVRYSTPEYHNVICIGAGVTSLSLACQMQMMIGEKDFLLLEREGEWGKSSLMRKIYLYTKTLFIQVVSEVLGGRTVTQLQG